jgi:hypothetical protein
MYLKPGDGLMLEAPRLGPLDVGLRRDRICMIEHGLGDQDIAAPCNARSRRCHGRIPGQSRAALVAAVDRDVPRSTLRCARWRAGGSAEWRYAASNLNETDAIAMAGAGRETLHDEQRTAGAGVGAVRNVRVARSSLSLC